MPPVSGQFDNLLKGDEIGRFLGQFILPENVRTNLESQNPGSVLPKTEADVLRDAQGIWERKGFLTPAELRAELIDKYLPNSSPQLKEFIKDVELSRNRPESVTGYLNKEHAYAATALSHLYAERTGKPIAMVEVDFSNMGGTNDKFRAMLAAERGVPLESVPKADAEKLTDRAVKLLSDSMANDLARELPPGAKITPVRTGGDEVRLIFTGVDDPAELKRIQAVIHASMERHVAGMGLQDHPHLKDPDNPVRNGFGAAVVIQDMRKIEDPKTLIQVLDGVISHTKNLLGMRRIGVVDEKTERAFVERKIDKGGLTIPEGQSRETFIAAEIDKTRAEVKAASEALHKLNPQHNPELKGGIQGFNDYVAAEERKMAASPLVSRTPPEVIAQKVPVDADRPAGLPAMASIEQRQTAVAENHFARQGVTLSEGERHFLGQSIQGLTSVDPSAQVLMPKEMAALTEVYAAETEEVQKKINPADPEIQKAMKQAGITSVQDIKPQALAVSFHGLASFNSVLGHENADYALRHMGADLIEGSLRQAGITPAADGTKPYAIAHHGGGNFSVIVQPVVTGADGKTILISPEKMKEVERNVAERLQTFGKTPVADFLESKGVPVSDTMREGLARKGVTDFASMPDSKDRVVKIGEQEITGRLSGVHAVTSTAPVAANDNLKGNQFIGSLRNQADAKMDALRNDHVIATAGPAVVAQATPPAATPAATAPATAPAQAPAAQASPAAPAPTTPPPAKETAAKSPTPPVGAVVPDKPAATQAAPQKPESAPQASPPKAPAAPAAVEAPAKGLAAVVAAAKSGELAVTAKTAAASHVAGNGAGMAMGVYGLSQKLGANGTAAADLKDERTSTLAKAGIASDTAGIAVDAADTVAKLKSVPKLATMLKVSEGLHTASRASKFATPVNVALTVATGAIDYKIASATGDGKRAAEAVGGSVGGFAGAAAGGVAGAKAGALIGATVGVWFGGVGAVPAAAVGSAIGGLVGAIGGGFAGAELGKKATDGIVKEKLQAKFDADKAEAVAAAAAAAAKPAARTSVAAANEPAYKSPSANVTRQASETFGAGAPKLGEHFKEAHAGTVAVKPAVNDPAYSVASTRPQSGMKV